MSRTQHLYALQQVDIEAGNVTSRLQDIATQLGESAELKRARKMVADAQTALSKCRARMQDLDLEVASLTDKIKADEQRLYSGRVGNPKELTGLQEEVASLKRRREKKEEDLIEAMLAVEEAEAGLADARAILSQVGETWQTGQGNLVDEQGSLQARLEQLAEQRTSLVVAIGPEDLATYERLRQRKGGRAVVMIANGVCQGCRMSPPTSQLQQAKMDRDLVFCNNCGRILHAV
jgi:predicted  nucleic acid-binding Zn-ribbon protein